MSLFSLNTLVGIAISGSLCALGKAYIPEAFQDNSSIEKLIIISDVDGVVRDNVESIADPRVISAIKSLLENENVDVAFLSGTPVVNDLSLEEWRRGNVALNQVFGPSFDYENVAVYGLFGGHRLKGDGSLEILEEYPLEVSFQLGKILIGAFLKEVIEHGNESQRLHAQELLVKLDQVHLNNLDQSILATPEELGEVIVAIRNNIDPIFRVMSNSCAIEVQFSTIPWTTIASLAYVKEAMKHPQSLISQFSPQEQQVVSGIARRNGQDFRFILASTTNKGSTSRRHLANKLAQLPGALIVTIGDTQGDFPMHEHAHVAFHVGKEHVWRQNALPQCVMVRGSNGKESQHVEGTLKVLELLKEAVGKPFNEFRYIPYQTESGEWDFRSLKEI